MPVRQEMAVYETEAKHGLLAALREAGGALSPRLVSLPPDDIDEWLRRFGVYFFVQPGRVADDDEMLHWCENIRGLDPDAHIVFFVQNLSKLAGFVRPAIRPSAVLAPPLDTGYLKQVLAEIGAQLGTVGEAAGPVFRCSAGGQTYLVPVEKISFFEASAKRMLLKTAGQEIAFYASFGDVLEQLPQNDSFFRCHKGFLVNLGKISAVNYAGMAITLQDGSEIPLARSAKAALRERLEGGRRDG